MTDDLCATCGHCECLMTAGVKTIRLCRYFDDELTILETPADRCDGYKQAESGAEPMRIALPVKGEEHHCENCGKCGGKA